MKKVFLVLALLLTLSSESEAQLLHDIRADSILAPRGKTPIGWSVTLQARFTNVGSSNEANVGVTCIVKNWAGIDYRDTDWVATWHSGQTVDVSFVYYTPQMNAPDEICAHVILSSDQ